MFFDPALGGKLLLLQVCLLILVGSIANFTVKLYRIRKRFQSLQRDGLPMPPHHPIFGHLQLVGDIMSKQPRDALGHILPHQIQLRMPDLGPVFYIDIWPFGPPMLVVASPSLNHEITQVHSLPKFPALRGYMRPMTGGNDLVSMESEEWRRWRKVFNPGFRNTHLMTLIPGMLRDVSTFCEILREKAGENELFQMDPLAANLSLDVIGRVVLDIDFKAQRSTTEFTSALRNQVKWLSFGDEVNPFDRFSPLRPIMQWWNNRRMMRYVASEFDRRVRSAKQQSSKTVLDLALDTYLESQRDRAQQNDGVDQTFKDFAISQVRTFIFAGHDTTGSTICYAFHVLSSYPDIRRALVAEHDRLLGPDYHHAAAKIAEGPRLLNQFSYTSAVIKETLRLYPPASSTRGGEPGYVLPGPKGLDFPTDGLFVWSNAYTIQRDPSYWPEPDKFIPERWLVEEGHRLYPVKGAFRPFEFGPRNCIGQELAMLELKIVLILTVREFQISSVYDEWDRLHPRKGPRTVDGERAYQILAGAAHPSDGLPCRVRLAAH